MPAAIAIPAIVGAGGAAATVIGAKKAAGAAKSAGATQAAAADRAAKLQQQTAREQLAAQRDYWLAAQRRTQPYVNLGNTAADRLAMLMGLSGSRQAQRVTPAGGVSGPVPSELGAIMTRYRPQGPGPRETAPRPGLGWPRMPRQLM